MARKEPDLPHELDPLKGGLKHNPFAALRKRLKEDSASSAPATQSGATAVNREGSEALRKDAGAAGTGRRAEQTEPGAVRADREAPRVEREVTIRERVSVRIERAGRGGKTVTIAEGPGLAERKQEPLALELLVREIARAMGTCARIEGAAIVVQGDQRERLITWLLARGFTGAIAGN